MSAVTSSQNTLPPPPAGSQKNAEKRPTPTNSKPPSSSAMNSSIPSTSDVFALILQMKDRMQRQDETNERILREIGDLKRQKKAAEDHSPLMPKSLSFDTPMITSQPSGIPDVQTIGESRGSHLNSAAMTQTSDSHFQPVGSYPQYMGSFRNSGAYPETQQFPGSYFIPGSFQGQGSSFVPGSSQVRILLRSRIIPDTRILTDARIPKKFANRESRCPSRGLHSNADHCFHWSLRYPRIPAIWIHIQCS